MLDKKFFHQIPIFLKHKQLPHFSWINFPSPQEANEQGLVGYGGKINVSYLLSAYLQGIFPWPHADVEVPLWFAPNPRGILELQAVKVSKSLKKIYKKMPFRIGFNNCFERVMRECQQAHKHEGIWITEEMIQGYTYLFKQDLAYCVECWDVVNNQLVGGLYGVCLGSFFSAESMFYTVSNASKIALYSLIELLQIKFHTFNIPGWIDTQMITPVVESFGGQYISREEFMQKLQQCDLRFSRSDFFP